MKAKRFSRSSLLAVGLAVVTLAGCFTDLYSESDCTASQVWRCETTPSGHEACGCVSVLDRGLYP